MPRPETPFLRAGLVVADRGGGEVQVGLSARRGAVIAGWRSRRDPLPELLEARTAATRRALSACGGLADARQAAEARTRLDDNEHLSADAAVWGVVHRTPGDGWDVLAARREHAVDVVGEGRVAVALTAALTGAGVGAVRHLPEGTSLPFRPVPDPLIHSAVPPVVGPGVGPVARQGPDQGPGQGPDQGPGQGPGQHPASEPDPPDGSAGRVVPVACAAAALVVIVDRSAADAPRADPLVAADLPHLSVVVREDDVVVGPLVVPGLTPCLRCLDLHRTDRDPAWPLVLSQVVGRPGRVPTDGETASCLLGAGLAALQVLAFLDEVARPAALGATLEVELPDGLVGRRSWPAHPRCGCHWPPKGR